MKILVLGSSGFIGRAVVAALSSEHEVFSASREPATRMNDLRVDLLSQESISNALNNTEPDVIVNCAGIVENSSAAKKNVEFTKNLLDQVLALDLHPKTIIICGSAAEYGVVKPSDLPVGEDVPLNALTDYGVSKKQESELALEYKRKYNLPIVVIRIFNPLGIGMNQKFLISKIANDISKIENGSLDKVKVNHLDSKRDYVAVEDVADAIKSIIEGHPSYDVYNVGSGVSTSNSRLIEMAIEHSHLRAKPVIIETSDQPEPLYAAQADISRIKKDLGWQPKCAMDDTVKKVINETRKR